MPATTKAHLRFRNQAAHCFLSTADDEWAPNSALKGDRSKLHAEFKSRGLNVAELNKMAHLGSKKYGKVPRLTLTADRWEFTNDGATDWHDDFQRAREERNQKP